MPAATSIALIASAVIAGGVAVDTREKAISAQKQGKREEKYTNVRNAAAATKLRNQELNEQSLADSKIKRAKNSGLYAVGDAAGGNKGGTILTSPLGAPQAAPAVGGGKTLLGQ